MKPSDDNYDVAEHTLIAHCIKLMKSLTELAIEEDQALADRTIELSKSTFDTTITDSSFIHFFDELFREFDREVNLSPSFVDINLSLEKYKEKYKEYMNFYQFLTEIFDFDFDNFREDPVSEKLITFFIRYMFAKRQFEFLLTLECYLVFSAERNIILKYSSLKEFKQFIVPKLHKKEIINYSKYQDIKNKNNELNMVIEHLENIKIKMEEKKSEERKEKDRKREKRVIIKQIKKMQARGMIIDEGTKNQLLQAIYNEKLWFEVFLSVGGSGGYKEYFKPLYPIESSVKELVNINSYLKEKLIESIPKYHRIYDDVNNYEFTLSYIEPETSLEFRITISDSDMDHIQTTIDKNSYSSSFNMLNLIDCLNIDADEFTYSNNYNTHTDYSENSYDEEKFPF